ncbi:MAG: molybdate ABC transporter permease subunit [SAR324 cluster bacterium]|nr:molybdate ABC transporter permease subunit [SAR324 cluster bacterium]
MTEQEIFSILLSLKVALVSTFLSLPLGVVTALWLSRVRFFGKSLIDALINLPLVLPPVVTGYGLLILFGNQGWLGSWLYQYFHLSLAFSWYGAALASAVIAFPLMIRAIRVSVDSMDRRLEVVAQTLGASHWRVFHSITLPLMMPGILAGMVLCFVRSLGEFGATIIFAGNIEGVTSTLPLSLFSYMQQPGKEMAILRLATVSAVLSLIGLWSSERMTLWFQHYLKGNANFSRKSTT